MKKIFSILICTVLLAAACSNAENPAETPKPKEIATFVFDQEDVLSNDQEKRIDSLLRAHEKRTGNEVMLITIGDYGTDKDMKTYVTNFMNYNSIGKKEKDNGVLIAYNPSKREVRIGTGLGTEKVLTDDKAGDIITTVMIPEFKEGRAFEGLWLGAKSVVSFLDKPENAVPAK